MSKPNPLPPLGRLREMFAIVPITPTQIGICSGLVWRANRGSRGKTGSVAGSLSQNSGNSDRLDWKVTIDKKRYTASRVIYYMANGIDPGESQVDHKDQNPLNNDVTNLRLGDDSMQRHNRGPSKNNISGAVGVSRPKGSRKWVAQLWHEGTYFYLRRHTCLIDGARAYNSKVIELKLDKIGKPLNDLKKLECDCEHCIH